MLAKLNTFALVGIDAVPVEAEVDVSAGLPKTVVFGRNYPKTSTCVSTATASTAGGCCSWGRGGEAPPLAGLISRLLAHPHRCTKR
jgi:hypothetical protein